MVMVKELSLVAIGAVTLLLILVGSSSDAEGAMYMKFEGIDGEAKDAAHKEWSDMMSFSQTIRLQDDVTISPGETRRRGDVILEDIVVVKELDKASPKLAEAILQGTVFPKVEIHLTASYTDAGRVTYYKYELTNVMVTSYSISGTGDDIPIEQFSLNFEEIKVTYTENDSAGKSKGNVEYSWKVEEGEA